jgi:ABC-type polysaccharide/polyol phosphate export permease
MTSPTTEAIASPRVATKRASGLGLFREGVTDLLSRQRLIRYLVGADLKRTHADTVFGQLWWIIDPLMQMAVYFFLVDIILGVKIDDYPLFLFVAIVPWKWFATTMNDATLSITTRQSLIRQVQFPKIVLPAASVIAGVVSFAFGLLALAMVYIFFLNRLTPWVLLLPLIAAVQTVFTLALAIALSAINAFYRDVQNVLRHVLRLWFYISPTLYALDKGALKGHDTILAILSLNPFAALLTSYRNVTWGTTAPQWEGLLYVLILSVVLLVLAIALFKRVEPAFARIL